MSSSEAMPGQRWGYRARMIDRLVEVEVLRLGTKRPLRVLVRFVGDDQEGHEEWVPPTRLKVPWSEAPAWQAREDRWQAVRAATGPIQDSVEERAVDYVLEGLPAEWDLAEAGYNQDAGVLKIRDCAALCDQLSLAADDLEHPAAFQDDDRWVVPWPITDRVVRQLAQQFADRLLSQLADDEARARDSAQWGETLQGGHYISPEACRRFDEKEAPARELIRQWCGEAATERYDELVALRAEVIRLGSVAEEAISVLRAVGSSVEADRLERDLGVPIETIRGRRAHES